MPTRVVTPIRSGARPSRRYRAWPGSKRWAPLSAGLYPGFLGLHFLQDPVFLVSLAVIILVADATKFATALAALCVRTSGYGH